MNLDFSLPFLELIQQVDVRNKRKSISFEDDGGVRTGLIIGRGDEQLVIYDKAKREKLGTPLSRIELRLSGRKLPSKRLADIPAVLCEHKFFLNTLGLKLTDWQVPILQNQRDTLSKFKIILERDGYSIAKRSENSNRNFSRDFKTLVKTTPWRVQPTDIFAEKIKVFFVKKWRLEIEGYEAFNQ